MTRVQNEIHHELRHAVSDLALSKRHIELAVRRINSAIEKTPDYSPMIRVKSITVMRELIVVPWHPMLKEVFFWTCDQWPGQIVVTSGHREGDKGVHGQTPFRGTDLRSREFKNPRDVEYKINQEWDYGKEPYQVCMYHQTVRCEKCGKKFEVDPDVGVVASTACPNCHAGGGFLRDFGPHFHLQSHDWTRRRA